MYRILLIEDEENILSFLEQELKREGYAVDIARDGEEALGFFGEAPVIDLVLLDIMLPRKNGLEVLREIRRHSTVPVFMLTARKDVYDKVALLDAGADDYITKPFDTMELLARIRRGLARSNKESKNLVTVDEPGCRVWVEGNLLTLTKTEFEMLAFLARHAGTVKTRDDILQAVYGAYYGESNNVDVNIKNIRKKIAHYTDAAVIETVRGRGYVMR